MKYYINVIKIISLDNINGMLYKQKRTEDNMLNKIEKTYTKDSIIIIGNWSIGRQMKNFISTPNLSLKRKLQERFKVYDDIDEYRTFVS